MKECQVGMKEIGDRYEAGKYFVSELMYAGEIMKDIMKELGPLLRGGEEAETSRGKVVLGTVKGDVHNLGKDVVALMLRGAGFEVIDLGVDVPAARFVSAAVELHADVIGMSALVSTTMDGQREVIELLREQGLADTYFTIVGGAPVSQQWADEIGADGYGRNAASAVRTLDDWLQASGH